MDDKEIEKETKDDLLGDLNEMDTKVANYKFEKHGIVILPAFIKPRNDTVMLRLDFKVDAGADTTTISKHDLINFGYDMN